MAKVPLPQMYANEEVEDEKQQKLNKTFNGLQRGHQNAVESYTMQVALSLIAGTKFPIAAAVANILWCVGRILYQQGYATKGPKGRLRGAIQYFGVLTVLGLTLWTSVENITKTVQTCKL